MTEGRCAQHPDGLDVQDVCDPDDPRLDDFRDLNSIDRRPDLPTGKALVIAEGVLVVQRMLASRFTPLALFGTGCADPLYRRAVRVSMGHALLVPYARAADWPTELMTLKESGFRLLAMTPHGNACKLPEAIAAVSHERIALLVGAEGPGLTAAALRISDVRVRIPMSRGTDSLNVATAAALAFYERTRSGHHIGPGT